MVVSCHMTVANYEYLIYWRFYQDGNIECEVRATGIMVTTPFQVRCRRPTAPSSTTAPTRRSISTSSSPASTWTSTVSRTPSWKSTRWAPPVSEENPYGLAVVTRSTPITSEDECARDYDWTTQRVEGGEPQQD